ncbi:MAG: DUF4129 domain-containing protein [Chloroflexota bacterium]|nr:DUF4129 domain-containing protein [Chloroflexota bacterium]
MKRLAITLSIVALLMVLSPSLSGLAQPAYVPHQNPAAARGAPDPASLLLFYGDVFDMVATRQYQDAQTVLKEVESARIPDELRYMFDSYNRLSGQLVTVLNDLETLLDEASTLFTRQREGDARQRLNEAEATVRNAQLLLEDVDTATTTLGEKTGALAAAVGGEIRQAYERQQHNVERVGQLITEIDRLRESLGLNPLMAVEPSFYYPTHLEVSVPETACPGLPVTISGEISPADGDVSRAVRVLLGNTRLAEETVQGRFSIEVTPPRQISTGIHCLTLVVAPHGHYAGTSKRLPINISGKQIRTEIQMPLVIVLPERVQIKGRVFSESTPVGDSEVSVEGEPVGDARVSLIFREAETVVKTAADGSFSAMIEAPFDLSLAGPQELSISVEPVEPWYASLEIEREVFAINPAAAGLMLFVFVSLGLLLFSRVRTSLPRLREEMVIPGAGLREAPAITPLTQPEFEFTGIKGRVLASYLGGLEAVEEAAGISMEPHDTLREFLNIALSRLPAAVEPFRELTAAAEVALYSAREPFEEMAAGAERLAATIKEELERGTA